MKNITIKKRICCLYLIGTITGVVSSSQAIAEIDITDNSMLDSQAYLRTGIETTEGGDSGVTFGTPEAISKYRLGNEWDTVTRLSMDYQLIENNNKLDDKNNKLDDKNKNKNKNKNIQAYMMIQSFTAHNSREKISFSNLDQAYISMDNYLTDGMTKTSLALLLDIVHGYWSRPVIRVFTAYAKWDDEFKAQVSDAALFADNTDGMTYTTQA